MKVFNYVLNMSQGNWDRAHFEFYWTDNERPFHISMRRGEGLLTFNTMSDGVWGQEEIFRPFGGIDTIGQIYVEAMDQEVSVCFGAIQLRFPMTVTDNWDALQVRAVNLDWTPAPTVQDDNADPAKGGKRLRQTRVAGRLLTLPKGHDHRLENELLLMPTLEPGSEYLQFLASRPLRTRQEALAVMDISTREIIPALTAALLFPDAKVTLQSGDAERDALVQAVASANGIENLKLLPFAKIRNAIAKFAGPTLVQGEGVFAELGLVLAGLTTEQRARLSVYTSEDAPVPGNIALPCHNLRIKAGPWCLNHSASNYKSGRRHGLDVTVAAYNAGDYLIECADSLLCEGRDDIRVIIVDDGSTDGSGEAAALHFRDDPRVRVERKPNGGCASARNYGRLLSDATHITFVDADDFVTPGFFADLYDLSLYTGCEVTQGGFDFHDISRGDPYYPSYEDELFAGFPRSNFGNQPVIGLNCRDIIKGQPTIWRKVYRRDFLDAKNIYFPENIRAYDDYIFHMLTLTAARDIQMMPEHRYHYRQHPNQDIKQGDERHFYMLQMFRSLLRRSIDEGWADFRPYCESIMDSISWSSSKLKPELIDAFLAASARLAVTICKTYGEGTLPPSLRAVVKHPDFAYHFQREYDAVKHLSGGVHWSYFSGPLEHPDTVRMAQSLPVSV